MGRFRFRLARVRRVREIREELARGELVLADRALREAQAKLDAALAERATAERDIGAAQARRELRPEAILVAQRVLPVLARRIEFLRAGVQRAAQAVELARSAWQAARSEERALEKLEERSRATWGEEQRLREDKVLQESVDRRRTNAPEGAGSVELER